MTQQEKYDSTRDVFAWSRALDFPQFRRVRSQDLIFISGQGPFDESGVVSGADGSAQIRLAFDNLARVLQAAGSTMPNVVSLTVYLANPDLLEPLRAIRREYFNREFPTVTTIAVSLLEPGMLVEISAVALAPAQP